MAVEWAYLRALSMILYPCMCASIPCGAAGGGRVDLWWWLGLGFGFRVPGDGPLGIPVFSCHRRGGGVTRGLSGGSGGSSRQIAGMRRGEWKWRTTEPNERGATSRLTSGVRVRVVHVRPLPHVDAPSVTRCFVTAYCHEVFTFF
jgi:hypothetical protein